MTMSVVAASITTVAAVASDSMIKNGYGGRVGEQHFDKPLTLPVGLVPEFYVRSTVAPGNTGQCLLKTCGIDSVSKLQKFCNKK